MIPGAFERQRAVPERIHGERERPARSADMKSRNLWVGGGMNVHLSDDPRVEKRL